MIQASKLIHIAKMQCLNEKYNWPDAMATPVIPAPGRPRDEEWQVKANLGYLVSSGSA